MDGNRLTIPLPGFLRSSTEPIPATQEAKGVLSLAFTAFFQTDTFNSMDEASQRRAVTLFQDLNTILDSILVARIEGMADAAGQLKAPNSKNSNHN